MSYQDWRDFPGQMSVFKTWQVCIRLVSSISRVTVWHILCSSFCHGR